MYAKILVPVDLSNREFSVASCKQAKELQTLWGSKVRLLSVIPGYSMPIVATFFPQNAMDNVQRGVDKALGELCAEHFEKDCDHRVVTGKRAPEILRSAREWKAELIVLASRPKESLNGQRTLGSCGLAVSERASCSVLIVR